MPKALTREQLQSRKVKAARFVREVLGDPDRASEIEGESLDSYAERRKIELMNPHGNKSRVIHEREDNMPKGESKAELLERIKELEEENDELQDQLDQVADIVSPSDEDANEDEDDESND